MDLSLHKGLNVLIGENNSGKTAIIDALRLCLGWGNQRKAFYLSEPDFYVDRDDHTVARQPIEFHLIFEIERDEEKGIFNDLLSIVTGQII